MGGMGGRMTLADRLSRGPLGNLKAGGEIKLSTRAADDPLANNAVEVPRITITPGPNNVSTASLEISIAEDLSVPISCDVTAMIDDQTFEFGTFYGGKVASTTFSSAGGYQTQIGNVDEQVTSAVVSLTPNPSYIKQVPGVTQIWGKPIILPNVPVERFDLEDKRP